MICNVVRFNDFRLSACKDKQIFALASCVAASSPLCEFFHIQVTAFLPDLVLFGKPCTDETQSRIVVQENSNHPFAAKD